jgi:hypothetical protein
MTTFKHLDVVSRVERPKLTPEKAAHAQRVRERNDWLKREVLKLNGGWPVSVRRVSRVKIDHLFTGAKYRTGYALSYEWCGPKSEVKCVRPFQADVGINGLLDGYHSIRSYKRHPCRPEDGC